MTWARGLGLLLVAYLAMIGNTALRVFVTWPLHDLVLLVALYAGLTCRLRGGAQVALRDASALSMLGLGAAIGYSSDVVMGTPRGLRALGLALLLLLLRGMATHLLVRGMAAVAAVSAVTTALFQILLSVLMLPLEWDVQLLGWRSVLGQAVATGLLAPLMFFVLSRIDSRLWRDPRAQGLLYGNS